MKRRVVAFAIVVAASLANAVAGTAAAKTRPIGAPAVTTSPALYLAFSSPVRDYVIRCTGSPVQVSVSAPPGTKVSVDHQPNHLGSFTTTVGVDTGQEFTIVQTRGNTRSTWYLRCLPTDFPNFSATVTGAPQAQYYLTVPIASNAFSGIPPSPSYVTMFDDDGVPIWWRPVPTLPVFATDGPNGDIAWTDATGPVAEANLDEQIVRTISSPDGPIDFHELVRLSNGDDLVAVDTTRCCFDLSSWGGGAPSSATIYDQVVEELNSSGQVVWSWDTASHIDPATATAPQFRVVVIAGGSPYDVYHLNSIEPNGGDVVISYRNLDAVYDVHKSDGSLVWKLGGSAEPESLAVSGDPVSSAGGSFCGQRDARVLADGTLTVHDNGSGCGRAPRAIRHQINTASKTATLVESVTDPLATSSACCGSARKLPGGDWVIAWGYTQYFTELTSAGARVFLLHYTDTNPAFFSYHVTPILPGVYTASQLRSGMNAQYPR